MKLLFLCATLVILVGVSPAYGDLVCFDGISFEAPDNVITTVLEEGATLGSCGGEQEPVLIEDEFDPVKFMEEVVHPKDRNGSLGDLFEDEKQEKIDFLENMLAQKNLEYEWLSEITDKTLADNKKLEKQNYNLKNTARSLLIENRDLNNQLELLQQTMISQMQVVYDWVLKQSS